MLSMEEKKEKKKKGWQGKPFALVAPCQDMVDVQRREFEQTVVDTERENRNQKMRSKEGNTRF